MCTLARSRLFILSRLCNYRDSSNYDFMIYDNLEKESFQMVCSNLLKSQI